jgi:hypothetical protein
VGSFARINFDTIVFFYIRVIEMRYQSPPSPPAKRQANTKERAARQYQARQQELRSSNSSQSAQYRDDALKKRAENGEDRSTIDEVNRAVSNWLFPTPASRGTALAGQQAYEFSKEEWDKDLEKQAKEYQWDTSQQENVSIAVLTVEEANEYLDLLIKDTHGQLSTGKDYTGVGMGLKGAYDVAKELGGWGATAKAVNINGVMNIVVESYKPRYLDLGIRWQQATPKMLKIGHALNKVKGNISFLRGNILVELVFSGAVNSVDYMLHDEKTLGEVVRQFTTDISKGIVTGVLAQGVTLILRSSIALAFTTPPTALLLGFFAISAFYIGKKVSELDEQYKYTDSMINEVERLINEN